MTDIRTSPWDKGGKFHTAECSSRRRESGEHWDNWRVVGAEEFHANPDRRCKICCPVVAKRRPPMDMCPKHLWYTTTECLKC